MFNNSEVDFERLELLFRRSNSLPELPGSALRIIELIDSGAASAIDLERIISTDPGLSGNLLRISNVRMPGMEQTGVTTIRSAIMKLGQRSVRNLAVSLIMQTVANGRDICPDFPVDRFAHHSLFVAFLSRYLFARRNMITPFESRWSADELFASGLLHDIGIPLLARVAPESYFRVHSFASRVNYSLEASFLKIYEKPITSLACTAVEAWALPDLFTNTLRYTAEPWRMPEEYTALCCLNYANHIAHVLEERTEDWRCSSTLMPEVETEIALQDDELTKVTEFIDDQVTAYLKTRDAAA